MVAEASPIDRSMSIATSDAGKGVNGAVAVKGQATAVGVNGNAPHRNRGAVGIDGNAGIARRAQNAAPIGVAPKNSGFDEVGVGDGQSHAARVVRRGRACNADGDEFGRAFSIACDLFGKANADRVECRLKGAEVFAREFVCGRRAIGQVPKPCRWCSCRPSTVMQLNDCVTASQSAF